MADDDIYDALTTLPGEAGDAARTDFSNAPLASETQADVVTRQNAATQQQAQQDNLTRQWGRAKAADLNSRGIANFTTPSGDTQPYTDATGAALTDSDPKNGVAYDSSGNPVTYSSRNPTRTPVVKDAYEDAPTQTDAQGNIYKTPKGLPWVWSGTDPDVAAAYQQKQQNQLNQSASTALAPYEQQAKIAATQANRAVSQSAKATSAIFAQTGANLTDDDGNALDLKDVDGPTLKGAIDDSFNKEYASDAANDQTWLTGSLSSSAQALRADIDNRKQRANAAADAHIQTLSAAQAASDNFDQIQQQRIALQAQKLDAVNRQRQQAGMAPVTIPGLEDSSSPDGNAGPNGSETANTSGGTSGPAAIPGLEDHGTQPNGPTLPALSQDQHAALTAALPPSAHAALTVPPQPDGKPQPEGFWATAGRALLTKTIPAAATAAAGLAAGAGAVASGAGSPLAISADIAGGTAAGYAANKAQRAIMGDQWANANDAQMEANAKEHPIAAQIGSTAPFLLSLLGGQGWGALAKGITTAGKTAMQEALQVGEKAVLPWFERGLQTASLGARAGASLGAQDPNATPGSVLDSTAKSAITMGALGLVPMAKTILGAALGKPVAYAGAMALAGNLYDAMVHGQPFDMEKVAKETGGNIPAFVLQNVLLGFLGHGMAAKQGGETAPSAEATPTKPAESPSSGPATPSESSPTKAPTAQTIDDIYPNRNPNDPFPKVNPDKNGRLGAQDQDVVSEWVQRYRQYVADQVPKMTPEELVANNQALSDQAAANRQKAQADADAAKDQAAKENSANMQAQIDKVKRSLPGNQNPPSADETQALASQRIDGIDMLPDDAQKAAEPERQGLQSLIGTTERASSSEAAEESPTSESPAASELATQTEPQQKGVQVQYAEPPEAKTEEKSPIDEVPEQPASEPGKTNLGDVFDEAAKKSGNALLGTAAGMPQAPQPSSTNPAAPAPATASATSLPGAGSASNVQSNEPTNETPQVQPQGGQGTPGKSPSPPAIRGSKGYTGGNPQAGGVQSSGFTASDTRNHINDLREALRERFSKFGASLQNIGEAASDLTKSGLKAVVNESTGKIEVHHDALATADSANNIVNYWKDKFGFSDKDARNRALNWLNHATDEELIHVKQLAAHKDSAAFDRHYENIWQNVPYEARRLYEMLRPTPWIKSGPSPSETANGIKKLAKKKAKKTGRLEEYEKAVKAHEDAISEYASKMGKKIPFDMPREEKQKHGKEVEKARRAALDTENDLREMAGQEKLEAWRRAKPESQAQRGAEYERMIIQHRTTGAITEAMEANLLENEDSSHPGNLKLYEALKIYLATPNHKGLEDSIAHLERFEPETEQKSPESASPEKAETSGTPSTQHERGPPEGKKETPKSSVQSKIEDTLSELQAARDAVKAGFGDDDTPGEIRALEVKLAALRKHAQNEDKAAEPAIAELSESTLQTGANTLADWVKDKLSSLEPFTLTELYKEAEKAFGGTQGNNSFTFKDATDAMEAGMNRWIRSQPMNPTGVTSFLAMHEIAGLKNAMEKLPTQGRQRNEEMETFQQFSTPPPHAYVANWVANIQPGEMMLEPSAGLGGLAVFAKNAGAVVVANELSPRRKQMLELLDLDRFFGEDAEQLNNILPEDVKPTVVVMNPPFSRNGARTGEKKDLMTGARHVEVALKRLQPNGRLVAIVGKGMTLDSPTFRQWWKEIRRTNNVRAVIGISGKEYAKYGTHFDNLILVIDKTGPTKIEPLTANVDKVEELPALLEGIRNDRINPTIEKPARPPFEGESETLETGPDTGGSVGSGESDSVGGRSGKTKRGSKSGRPGGRPNPEASGDVEEPSGPHSEPVLPAKGSAKRPKPRRGGINAPSGGAQPAGQGQRGAESGRAGLTPEEEDIQKTLREAGLFSAKPYAAVPGIEETYKEGETYDAPLPDDKIGAFVALAQRIRPKINTAEDLAKSLDAIGPKAVPYSQGLWHLLKAVGAKGPSDPDWSKIYAAQNPEPENKTEEAEVSAAEKGESDNEDQVFDRYQPSIKVKGSVPNATPLAESSAMASVDSPRAKYAPKIDPRIITEGMLSDAQLETLVLAGAAHAEKLPSGERKGFFCGDGTGVGKTRQIVGLMLDNWNRGRKKHVWISMSSSLLGGAKNGMEQLLWNPGLLIQHGKTKLGEPIPAKEGILFTSYNTLAKETADPVKGVQKRIDQIVNWLGKDFDGVIALDEAHQMGNAVATKGARGVKKASMMAMAGIALQDALPNARVVYFSATGATEVRNLAYATRLGLWGAGTPFRDVRDFVSKIESSGVAAMEMVARDMKAMGLYLSRNIAYNGVEYDKIIHNLTPDQEHIYDELAGAWQLVLNNMTAALDLTDQKKNGNAKSQANSKFWGAHQRFFNQVITAMEMPSVIDKIEESIKAGRAPVIQLVNTNAAQQERILADKAAESMEGEEAPDYEEMDFTPRQSLMDYIERGFPTQQYEEYEDEEGNKKTRPVVDSQGKPVHNAEAVAMREALLLKLAEIRVPENPLDMMLDHFGVDNVAEVTGRTARLVRKPDKDGNVKKQRESWSKVKGLADANSFQDDKKQLLIFSAAGGTGMDYHADLSRANQRPRDHITIQAGWRADSAVQGFGRTHRNNQKQPPKYYLASTNLNAQKRFVSTIARRLDQLGALTKGQRDTGSQGMMSAMDNLENDYAVEALRSFLRDLIMGHIEGVSLEEFEESTGQKITDKDGNLSADAVQIKRFLNRLLNFKVAMMNRVWDAFFERFEAIVSLAAQRGELDTGMETIKAQSAKQTRSDLLNTDQASGAATHYNQVELTHPTKISGFDVMKAKAKKGWMRNKKSGQVWAYLGDHNHTTKGGSIITEGMLFSHRGNLSGIPIVMLSDPDKWEEVSDKEAEPLVEKQIAETPKTYKETAHMITGALLPIWNRLKGNNKVYRVTLDSGKRLLGRRETDENIGPLLNEFKIAAGNAGITPDKVLAALDDGTPVRFADGTRLSIRSVYQNERIEITGPQAFTNLPGKFSERIGYEARHFLPRDNAQKAIEQIMINNPPVSGVGSSELHSAKPSAIPGLEGYEEREPEKKPAKEVRHGRASVPEGTPELRAENATVTGPTTITLHGAKPLYHGTPHEVDKFSTEKIGTGEGAQAYGHGLYFAENPETAKAYRDALANEVKINGKTIFKGDSKVASFDPIIDQTLGGILASNRASGESIKDALIKRLEYHAKESPSPEWDAALAKVKASDIQENQGGNVYLVRVKPSPEEFLDWDKPLQDQPLILEKVIRHFGTPESLSLELAKNKLLQDAAVASGDANSTQSKAWDAHDQTPEYNLGKMLSQMEKPSGKLGYDASFKANGGSLHAFLAEAFGSPRGASEFLSSVGIKGIRYLDSGSRNGRAEATRNYVIFDADDIEITHKNGEPVKLSTVLHSAKPGAEDDGSPAMGDTAPERLTREAEAAGVILKTEELKGLIREDPKVMEAIRAKIKARTGSDALYSAKPKTLFRAANEPEARTGAHFSENESDAEAYQKNPGFGGDNRYQFSVDSSRLADIPKLRDLANEIYPHLDDEQKEWADENGGLDQAIKDYGLFHVFQALENVFGPRGNRIDPGSILAEKYDWIRFDDDFPEGSKTWRYLGKEPLKAESVRHDAGGLFSAKPLAEKFDCLMASKPILESVGWYNAVNIAQAALSPDSRLTEEERKLSAKDPNFIGNARKTAMDMNAVTADMDRRKKQWELALKEARTLVQGLSEAHKLELMKRVDEGTPLKPGPYKAAFEKLAQLDADRTQDMKDWFDKMGRTDWQNYENFLKNIVPHYFAEPELAAKVTQQYIDERKKMSGSGGFLKHRTGFTMREIMDWAAQQGITLKPKHENVVDAIMDRWTQQERYRGAHTLMEAMAADGRGHWENTDYIPRGDQRKVSNIVGRRHKDGHWQEFYTDAPSAQIINNYLSRGLRDNQLVNNYFIAANALNSLQLGLSGFHAGFVTAEGMVSTFSLGLQKILAGDMKGFADVMKAPFSTVSDFMLGKKNRKEMLHPGSMAPDMTAIVDQMVMAGYRQGVDAFYHDQHIKAMFDAFRAHKVVRGALRAPLALIELVAKPIMEFYVPYMKGAAIYKLAEMHLKQSPNMTATELQNRLNKDVESGNNRFGQMTYDNLHLHKTVKDILMGLTRSLGWNWGTFSELGGGITDWLSWIKNMALWGGRRIGGGGGGKDGNGKPLGEGSAGKMPRITNKMAYVLALPLLIGLFGAVLAAMFGIRPKRLKDYYFVQTGDIDDHGNPVRLVLPSYMKDFFHAAAHPLTTITNKLHPILSMIGQMLMNKDFYGIEIRHSGDPVMKQILEELGYIGKQIEPFSIRNTQKQFAANASTGVKVAGLFGVTQAPSSAGKTAAEELASELVREGIPPKARTQQQADHSALVAQIVGLQRVGKGQQLLQQSLAQGKITASDVRTIQRNSLLTPLQQSIHHLSLQDAEKVAAVANPEEKRQIQPMIAAKSARAGRPHFAGF